MGFGLRSIGIYRSKRRVLENKNQVWDVFGQSLVRREAIVERTMFYREKVRENLCVFWILCIGTSFISLIH